MSEAQNYGREADRTGLDPPAPAHPIDLLGDRVTTTLAHAASRFAPIPMQLHDLPGTVNMTPTWLVAELLGAWRHNADGDYDEERVSSPADMRRAVSILATLCGAYTGWVTDMCRSIRIAGTTWNCLSAWLPRVMTSHIMEQLAMHPVTHRTLPFVVWRTMSTVHKATKLLC